MGIVENTYAELKKQELNSNPYSCLHMADIDINPHQIETFTFALSSLELGGAILADEVGLGKTIEAGLIIKYLLCSGKGKDKILLIMPSNLRKQWQVELEEKFDIDSLIVDSSNWEDYLERVKTKQAVIIVSYHFASKRKVEFGKIAWDFCVFDEAHRLRNVYKNGSKMANSLYELTKGIPKILLTATPMQNTLLDIYGLVQFIDDRVFYSKQIFSERYLRGEDYNDLKACLEPVVQRTLTGKIYGASDVLVRELCKKLQEQCLEEKTPNNQEIPVYIDKVDEFMQQKYAESKRTVLIANQKKLDNWLQSRKEEYLLRVKDTSELDELKDKYVRDLSNYENFVGFHSQMYRYVEGTTATPFAARARDRVLHALVVSLLRLQVETMADNGGASRINDISDEQIKDIKDKILERVKITAPSSYVDTEKEMLKRFYYQPTKSFLFK